MRSLKKYRTKLKRLKEAAAGYGQDFNIADALRFVAELLDDTILELKRTPSYQDYLTTDLVLEVSDIAYHLWRDMKVWNKQIGEIIMVLRSMSPLMDQVTELLHKYQRAADRDDSAAKDDLMQQSADFLELAAVMSVLQDNLKRLQKVIKHVAEVAESTSKAFQRWKKE